MKKDLIFAPVMLVLGVLLFLLRMTGMTVHIAISIGGVVTRVASAIAAVKERKLPALAVPMRVCYGIALFTGIVEVLGALLGFRNDALVALLVMSGTPSAVSSYIMAQNMGNDGVLANGIVAVTTLLSAVTMTGWIFLLRTLTLI